MHRRFHVVCCAGFAATLTGCAARETIPTLRFAGSTTGVEVGPAQSHGPKSLLDYVGATPDTPSGTWVRLKRAEPLHNTEPRYFVAASGVLQAVSIERPVAYNTPSHNFEDDVRRWKKLLSLPAPTDEVTRQVLSHGQLSEIPWVNAGRCFHAKLRYRTFPWGRAVMFLTSYVQGSTGGPVNNDMLVLVVQGITNDGRYAVNGHFAIHHPKLPDSSWDERTKGKAVFDIDHEDAKAEAWLNAQQDDAFQPSLPQYETFLEDWRVEPPTSG